MSEKPAFSSIPVPSFSELEHIKGDVANVEIASHGTRGQQVKFQIGEVLFDYHDGKPNYNNVKEALVSKARSGGEVEVWATTRTYQGKELGNIWQIRIDGQTIASYDDHLEYRYNNSLWGLGIGLAILAIGILFFGAGGSRKIRDKLESLASLTRWNS